MDVIVALPARDFDPTEAAVPWWQLTRAGHTVRFATPHGKRAKADPRLLGGWGFGPFQPLLLARGDARHHYAAMARDEHFASPMSYQQLCECRPMALVLPGGHAPGMRSYLESVPLQTAVANQFRANRAVAAICHGVLVAARARDGNGRSLLHGRKTTALLASMELSAWLMTRAWLGDYYRTYPETVESEVKRHLASEGDFIPGRPGLLAKVARLLPPRDRAEDSGRGFALRSGFALRDGNYLSARWPGDAYTFSRALIAMLDERWAVTSAPTRCATPSAPKP